MMHRNIPFHRPSIEQEEIEEVVDTLKSGWLTTGNRCKQYEKQFSAYSGVNHCLALNSCTAALHLAVDGLGLKAGDGVIVPTMTFTATAEIVRYLGAVPILIDCDPYTQNINLHQLEEVLATKGAFYDNHRAKYLDTINRIVGIIPVHFGGLMVNMKNLNKIASKNGLWVVEDCAHVLPGYTRAGKKIIKPGQLSNAACFSFYANKTITTGEGGLLATNNKRLAKRAGVMSLHGISKDAWKRYSAEGNWYYEVIAPGYKYNMTDIAAAMGMHQLKKADDFLLKRKEIAEYYLANLGEIDEIELPNSHDYCSHIGGVEILDGHSWHLYVIRLNLKKLSIDRDGFIAKLKERGIGTSVHYMPLHLHPYYRRAFGYRKSDFPVASKLYGQIISLPIYPSMSIEDQEYVCKAVKNIVSNNLKLRY